MASLNSQAFMLGIIQPISPMYVVSKWNTGVDREFLLRLFIKPVDIKVDGSYREYLNDPASPRAMAEFGALVHSHSRYTVHSITDTLPTGMRDHSMQALALLNELVSVAKSLERHTQHAIDTDHPVTGHDR